MTVLSTNSILILDIKYGTSVDGVGLRTSIYCAGCENGCPGCHNPQSWDENGGKAVMVGELFECVVDADMNVTFTGGDPMLHPEGFTELARMIKSQTDRTIWCYTGFTYEEVLVDERLSQILPYLDALVEGPFILEKRTTELAFRGSSNQRIIQLR